MHGISQLFQKAVSLNPDLWSKAVCNILLPPQNCNQPMCSIVSNNRFTIDISLLNVNSDVLTNGITLFSETVELRVKLLPGVPLELQVAPRWQRADLNLNRTRLNGSRKAAFGLHLNK